MQAAMPAEGKIDLHKEFQNVTQQWIFSTLAWHVIVYLGAIYVVFLLIRMVFPDPSFVMQGVFIGLGAMIIAGVVVLAIVSPQYDPTSKVDRYGENMGLVFLGIGVGGFLGVLLFGALRTFSQLEWMLAGIFLASLILGVGILALTFTHNYKTLKPLHYEGVFGGLALSFAGMTGMYIVLALSFPIFSLSIWIACYALYITTFLGITIGYHRLATHVAFKCGKWFTRMVYAGGGGAGQWPVAKWGPHHKIHHVRTEIEAEDPHTPGESVAHAHNFWIFHQYIYPFGVWQKFSQRFERDPLIQEQKKYYPWAAGLGLFVPPFVFGMLGIVNGGEWSVWHGAQEAFKAFLLCGMLRMAIAYHMTFFVNSWAHKFGPHPYEGNNTGDSRDVWYLALFTAGETLQNIHHLVENLTCYWIKPYYFDFSGAILVACYWLNQYQWLGWAGLPYKVNLVDARIKRIIEREKEGGVFFEHPFANGPAKL